MDTCTQICGFELEKYAITMKSGQIREGIYIHLQDTNGNKATGEVAPLPGRSLETLDDAYKNLEKLKENFLKNHLEPFALHPSVMFGMQMALYSLQNQKKSSDAEVTRLYSSAPTFFHKGPVKLKMGHLSIDEAAAFFHKCDRGEKSIRIDLERKWDLEKSVAFCTKINTDSIVYIEDPVENYSDLEVFYEKTGVQFAIDNFLSFQPVEKMKTLKGLHSIVVKPSLVGGLHECKELQKAFTPIPISLSSLYESEVGINHIKLISSILCPGKPAGVDTLKLL
ncbi:MAG: o-succinylbenzoate synthase [Chlamydiia bacterium]|nr:o-succinylbenzoate synthase [Chlamydiia bacterium]MCH9618145.1 o-succinylbenzoate synthase [Chlamydiia bacterium]MCH9624025.1 o-succinylbenzoate synthase [Chlamydiia bacterium]